MKKILFFLSMISVAFYSCDPMEDIYSELETTDPSKVAEIEHTLTDDDYKALNQEYGIAKFFNFNSTDEAKQYVPFLLKKHYPYVGEKSSVLTTYKIYRGRAPEVDVHTGADLHVVNDTDYYLAGTETGDAGFYNNDVLASDQIPQVLAANIIDPADGHLTAVSYEYANKAYADIAGMELIKESFTTQADFDQYTTFSLEGDKTWVYGSFSGDGHAKMSGYSGGNQPNTDWLVLPELDLSLGDNPVLVVQQVLNYLGSGVIGEDIAIKISTDYTGDVSTATWNNVVADQWPFGGSWTPVTSTVNLEDYAGKQVYIAFFYRSTADFAPNWQVSEISLEVGEPVETVTRNIFYSFEGSDWKPVKGVDYLGDEDYDIMGAPGTYNNFSSSVSPDGYLPAYLKSKYPYAQEEDEQIVVYKYYSSGKLQTRGDLFTFLNGTWEKYQSVVAEALQFGKEAGEWVPDNTIKYSLTPADYTAIANNDQLGNASARSNLATYGNFNTNGGYWTKEDIVKAIDFILQTMNPGAAEGQKYLVSYDTYPAGPLSVHVILTNGEYIEIQ